MQLCGARAQHFHQDGTATLHQPVSDTSWRDLDRYRIAGDMGAEQYLSRPPRADHFVAGVAVDDGTSISLGVVGARA